MNQRAEYLLQVLEKLGSPLMTSIMQAPGRGQGDETHKDAQRMAELLAKTTQASIEMSRTVDFGNAPDGGDSLRVALAALAGGLIGSYYKNSGKVPGDSDLKRMTAALQTVLTYSENFVPGADAAVRMENLAARGQLVDAQQASLQYIHAFIPVVNAITAFPFGNPEQKLIMDVAAKIVQKAQEMRMMLFASAPSEDHKRVELALASLLAKIYAACHEAETARLMSLTEEQRNVGGLGMDTVWKTYDMRVAIVEALAKTLVPAAGQGAASGGSQGPAPATTPPPVMQQTAPPPTAQPPVGQSPLSMFKKPDSAASSPTQPAAPPPAAPPPYTPPPAAQNPANPPPAQDSGSSPMGFFKKKE